MPDRPGARGPEIILVMGVAGSGKTTLGRRLAAALGAPFIEADDYHSPANLNKMRAGVPLDDADRAPWLASLAQALSVAASARARVVCACSALKRAYRERLRRGSAVPLFLIYLDADRELLRTRLVERRSHFMPASLLESQLQSLEPPDASEEALRLNAALPVEELVAVAQGVLARRVDGATGASQPSAPGKG